MTDKEVEDIIKSNMNLQMNLAGIRTDFEEKLQRTWVGLSHEEIDYQAKKDDHAIYFALGALWAEAKLKEKNGG